MGTPTSYYVDPLNGDDSSGDGSSGSPWQTVSYALDTGITRDSTNGDQVNIRDTGNDTSFSNYDFGTSYGYPTAGAPLILRGYTSSAGDGGVGVLDGDGGRLINTGADYIHMVDLRITNGGTGDLIKGDNYWTFSRCQIDDCDGIGLDMDQDNIAINCHFTDISNTGFYGGDRSLVQGCTFENDGGSRSFVYGVNLAGATGWNYVTECLFKLSGSSWGIGHSASYLDIRNNSFYSSSGGTSGYGVTGSSSNRSVICINNLVEGFGTGIRLRSWNAVTYGHNAAYNNGTNYDITADVEFALGDNEALSASPFTSSSDFTPVDTGNVLGGSYPTSLKGLPQSNARDKGAIQKAASGGGGGGGGGGSRRSRIRLHN